MITICIPTFNRVSYLEILLCDLISINFKYKIIITDNSFNDDTKYLVEKFKNILNIEYTKNNYNVGFDKNYLKSIENVNTDYIWVIGDDDRIVKNGLYIVEKILNSEKPDGLIVGYKKFTNDADLQLTPINNYSIEKFILTNDYKDIGYISTCIYKSKKIIESEINSIYFNGYIQNYIFINNYELNSKWIKTDAQIINYRSNNFIFEKDNIISRLDTDLKGYLLPLKIKFTINSKEYNEIFKTLFYNNFQSWIYQIIKRGYIISLIKIFVSNRKLMNIWLLYKCMFSAVLKKIK